MKQTFKIRGEIKQSRILKIDCQVEAEHQEAACFEAMKLAGRPTGREPVENEWLGMPSVRALPATISCPICKWDMVLDASTYQCEKCDTMVIP